MANYLKTLYLQKDKWWTAILFSALLLTGLWNYFFLNAAARKLVFYGFLHTVLIAALVSIFSLMLGWGLAYLLFVLKDNDRKWPLMTAQFFLSLIRSVPQLIGVLFGYVLLTYWLKAGSVQSDGMIFLIIALSITLFVFLEIVDLLEERIAYFKSLDFYHAMRVCGIPRRKIVNLDIIWQNSRVHLINKLIALFGASVFLQCSVDFIISVGLSTEVSSVNLPVTLGSLLAKIDSKQDILAIGYTITHPGYFPNLFFEHLQGITVAFLIVFLLLSIYKIANGYAKRHRL